MASVLFYFCAVLCVVSWRSVVGMPTENPAQQGDSQIFTHRVYLDREGKVVLLWQPRLDDIVFELQVQAKGWVGMGFSPDGKMPNSDVVVGWVSNGEPSLQDRFASGHTEPVQDDQQNYKLLQGYENETHTVLRFERKYDTCDMKDAKITNDTMRIIYSYTDEDPVGSLLPPHKFQGYRNVILTSMNNVVQGVIPNTKTFEMRLPNITIPRADKTFCWQKVFKYTPTSSREVVIGFEPLWRNSTAPTVDHCWLYRCDGNVDPIMWDQYSGDRGSVCDSPDAIHQYGNCTKVFATAAAGSLGYTLPGKVSYSLNQAVDGPSYFLLRCAYSDWKAQDADIEDDTGIALIYSTDTIPFPAATLTVGHDLGLSQIIPLDQKAFVTLGHCDADCTKKGLPSEGIFIYEVFFDARSTGRKMTLRHMRNGTELEPIMRDEQFVSNSQTSRMILEPVNLMPGDNLILECVYDTTHAQSTLVGGITPDSEACRAYLNYFPRVEMQSCTSSPPLNQIFEFLGTKQITIEPATINYKETSPAFAPQKLVEYVKFFNWVNRAPEFQNLTKSTYTSICNLGKTNFEISEPRGVPKIDYPYYEISQCNMLMGDNNTQTTMPGQGQPFPQPGQPLPGIDQPPIFHPEGSVPHATQGPFDPMLGDQFHGTHMGTMGTDMGVNDTSNFIDTHGNHSASTQAGNAANSLKSTCQLTGLLTFVITIAALTSRQ